MAGQAIRPEVNKRLSAWAKTSRDVAEDVESSREAILNVAELLAKGSPELDMLQQQLEALDAREAQRAAFTTHLRAAATQFIARAAECIQEYNGIVAAEHAKQRSSDASGGGGGMMGGGDEDGDASAEEAKTNDVPFPDFSFERFIADLGAGSAASASASSSASSSSASSASAAPAVAHSDATRSFMIKYGAGAAVDEDGDIMAVGGNAGGLMNAKCPISMQPIADCPDPVKSKSCGHLYSREAIEGYIKQQRKFKGQAHQPKCPQAGCSKIINVGLLKKATDVLREQKRGKKRRRAAKEEPADDD
jgi:hypothetical protein|tara:strand:+ start:96 stop:1013 length:918 start_codon:yes stop_codon:yes gene_type:complete